MNVKVHEQKTTYLYCFIAGDDHPANGEKSENDVAPS
jgi:hypothetical protein